MPARALLLVGLLLLILVIPFSQGSWGEELPWIKLISAAAGPAAIYYLYWFYWRDTASPDASRRRQRELVLVGSPVAAVVGVALAGGSGTSIVAAAVIGAALGCAFWFFAA
jgi:hypothetical protein